MIKHIVIVFFVGTLVNANQNAVPPSNTDSSQPEKGEDMSKKIKGIAKGIVDKWISEGLTVTREKVEGWIDKIDQAKELDMDRKNLDNSKVIKENTNQEPGHQVNNLGDNFKDVKETVVKTFTKIGEVKCEDCEKAKEANKEHDRTSELPMDTEVNVNKDRVDDLENLSVEELIKKQDVIKQYLQMEKIVKLANVAKDFSDIGKLKDIANLANTFNTLKKTTAREEL